MTEIFMDYLHDAELLTIHIDRKKSIARLYLQRENGTFVTVHLYGVKKVRCEDFVIQNVVSRLHRSFVERLEFETLVHWIDWVCALSDAPSWTPENTKRNLLDVCRERSLELVILIPSAGAQFAAVCERSEIQDDEL